MNNNLVEDENLIYNTSKRVPICVCVNTSAFDMEKNHINDVLNEVKKGLEQLYKIIEESDMIRESAEVSVISFDNQPIVLQDYRCDGNFIPGSDLPLKIQDANDGRSDLGKGVMCALDLLQNRKQLYNVHGVGYYQPWLIVISDGKPTIKEYAKSMKVAAKNTLKLEKTKKLTVITINISGEASADSSDCGKKSKDKSINLSKNIEPQLINKNKIAHFFDWLGQSIDTVAFENEIKLDFSGLTDWEDI